MNLADLKRRVYAVLRDSPKSFVKDADVEDLLNEAACDLAARLGVLQTTKTGTTSGSSIAFPASPEVARIVSLRLGSDDDVEFTDDEVFWSWSDGGDTPDHTLGRVWNETIELYPTPTTGTAYSLRYAHLPTAVMEGPEDIPELPTQLHPKLVHYARAHALYRCNEESKGDRFLALYEDGLPPVSTGVEASRPGPLSISLEPGPFDSDPDARHI